MIKRGQTYSELIFFGFVIFLVALFVAIFGDYLQSSLPRTHQVATSLKEALPKAEVVSYYANDTHVIFYVKFYDEVNESNVVFYVNKDVASIVREKSGPYIQKGEVVKVISLRDPNTTIYHLAGIVSGTHFVLKTVTLPEKPFKPIPTPTEKTCPWYFPTFTCRIPIYVASFSPAVEGFQLNMSIDTSNLVSSGKMRADCNDMRFTAIYPYEGTSYLDGLILNIHFDGDVKDYSGLNNDGTLSSGTYVPFVFNQGLENATVVFPSVNVSQFTITAWINLYNNSWMPPQDWWDANWKYRIPINVSNGNANDIFDYPIKFVVDTIYLYSLGKVQPDLSDIRVIERVPVYYITINNPNAVDLIDYQVRIDITSVTYTNFSVYNTQTKTYLNYCFEQVNGECNQTRSNVIWVKVDLIPANSNVVLAIIPEGTNKAVGGDLVFDLYDDFSSGVLNSTKWVSYSNQGVVNVVNGRLVLEVTSGTSGNFYAGIYSVNTFQFPLWAEAYVVSATTGAYIDVGEATNTNIGEYGLLYPGYSNEWAVGSYIILAIGGATWNYVTWDFYTNTPPRLMGFAWVDTGNQKVAMDGTVLLNGADTTYTIGNYHIFVVNEYTAGAVVEIEWIRARKYADREPTVQSITQGYLLMEIPFIFETTSGFSNTDNPASDTWVWAKVKYLPANGVESLYIYYGNPNAVPLTYTVQDIFGNNFMEIGRITLPAQTVIGEWFSFSFSNSFTSAPILIIQPDVTYIESDPLTIWLKGINISGFQARQKEPSNLDDIHSSENAYYIAVPEGSWETSGGVRIEAGKFNTTNWDLGDGTGTFTTVNYQYSFVNAPVVITQLQEISDIITGGWEAHTRIRNVGTSSFETAPEPEGQIRTAPNINVEIGWIAIETHDISKDFAKYVKSESGIVSGVTSSWTVISFKEAYSSPGFVGWIETTNGGDSSRLRGQNLVNTGISVMIQEDTTWDAETNHIAEDVGYLAFEYSGVPITIYLRKYIPNIFVNYGNEESNIPERKRILVKYNSFGIEVFENNIYGFVNTTTGYYEVSYTVLLNTTYFVSLVYDSASLQLYLNGSMVSETVTAGNLIQNNNNLVLSFLGKVDELRIYNFAFSKNRILQEYQRTLERDIPYWYDPNTCNTTNTLVYVKLPVLSTQTIYMYYCDPNAISASDGNSVFEFFDNFEAYSGWIRFDYDGDGLGNVSWDCTVSYDGSCSGHKIEDNDPNGAYKPIGKTLNRGIILEFWVNRNPSYAGGSYDRIGVIDDSGNGYGFAYAHNSATGLAIDRRTSYTGSVIASSDVGLDVMGDWYFARFTITGSNLISEYYYNGVLQDRVIASDTTYSTFTNVYIFGGYDYWVDQIRIRKYVSPWPQYSLGTEETC